MHHFGKFSVYRKRVNMLLVVVVVNVVVVVAIVDVDVDVSELMTGCKISVVNAINHKSMTQKEETVTLYQLYSPLAVCIRFVRRIAITN